MSIRDVVIISSLDWDTSWQGPHEIATRLAEQGSEVLFIENTGIRAPRLPDLPRVLLRLKRQLTRKSSAKEPTTSFSSKSPVVISPLVLPPFRGKLSRALNRKTTLRSIVKRIERMGMQSITVVSFLPTDTAVDLINALGNRVEHCIYYCAADFEQLTDRPALLLSSEQALVDRCDLVLVNLEEIKDRLCRPGRTVLVRPWGVSLSAFPLDTRARESPSTPTIGYVGGLHRHFATVMLAEMARARPEWRWVLVGPVETDIRRLKSLPNIELVGKKPHSELHRYIVDFDVCLVPYVQNEYTKTLVPVKINEYLAVGKRVVATSLPYIGRFNAQHKTLVLADANGPSFLRAIEEALRLPDDLKSRKQRRNVAELYSWDSVLKEITESLDSRPEAK